MCRSKLFRQEFTPDLSDWYPEILEILESAWNKPDVMCTIRALASGFAMDERAKNCTFPPVDSLIAKCPFLAVFVGAFRQGFSLTHSRA
jgi:hypothetical protein